MSLLTIFRALAWLGVAIVFWSLNIQWGTDPYIGNGPPAPWQRAVVGSGLLALLCALALSASGRGGRPPSYRARGIALVAAAGIVLIALILASRADSPERTDWIRGPGWTWLVAGGGLTLGAAVGALGLRAQAAKARGKKRKRRTRPS